MARRAKARPGPSLRPLRFRTVELNTLGWSALLGFGLLVGSLAGLIVGLTDVGLVAVAAAAEAGTWLIALAVDRRRDQQSFTNIGVEAAADVLARLQAAGVTAEPGEYRVSEDETWRYATVQNKDLPAAGRALGWAER